MMSRKDKPIIEVKGLSKEYRIGMDRTYKRFTESFTNAVRHPIRTLRGLTDSKDTFWALKDINFEVERGEVLGIIGRNGAGKSTLLKILSRITYPTEGEIVMRGRVGSLLEVGTGFHPELTGRENIYFNGAILGMKKREIDDKFDEIVKFSGVEKFLDTPVKRYSSGMNVRLAFSVAAHLEPEILLVDEVLAVGDAEFQKKCLGKMGEVAGEGRTVLFVSHNLDAVEKLCNKIILIEEGKLKVNSRDVRAGISEYLSSSISNTPAIWQNSDSKYGNKYFKPEKIMICNEKGDLIRGKIQGTSKAYIIFEGIIVEENPHLSIGYYLYSDQVNTPLYLSETQDMIPENWPRLKKGRNVIISQIPLRILNEGTYKILPLILVRQGQVKELIVDPRTETVKLSFGILGGLSDSPIWNHKRKGILAPVLRWERILDEGNI